MIEDAQSRRAASEQWIEKFARYYTPAMIALAIGIAVLPPLLTGANDFRSYGGLSMLHARGIQGTADHVVEQLEAAAVNNQFGERDSVMSKKHLH